MHPPKSPYPNHTAPQDRATPWTTVQLASRATSSRQRRRERLSTAIAGLAITALAASGGLSLAILGSTITLPDGTVVQGLTALARALESRSLANIESSIARWSIANCSANSAASRSRGVKSG